FYPDRYTTDPDGAEGVWAAARARKAVEWTIFSNALGDKPFMLGDNLSAVDIYASMLISWIEPLDAFFAVHRNLQAVYGRVAAVPAIRAVWERHGVPM
ncbi:MAG: glutathione binding-like protein, partial [Mesorhizobium sp.]|nr:glutathione binding-like protein [Mesorhizobium sp.]